MNLANIGIAPLGLSFLEDAEQGDMVFVSCHPGSFRNGRVEWTHPQNIVQTLKS
jgi:hypothetical protein